MGRSVFPANLKVVLDRANSSNQCATLYLLFDSVKLVSNPFLVVNLNIEYIKMISIKLNTIKMKEMINSP